MKVAQTGPISEINQPMEFKYRPVPILPVLSKTNERFVSEQVIKFIEEKLIYNRCQFGYCKKHSLQHCSPTAWWHWTNNEKYWREKVLIPLTLQF